jgi:hypothetical protein
MSTSLLYQAFGLVGYRYVSQAFQGGRVTFCVEQPRQRLRCSHCGSGAGWWSIRERKTLGEIAALWGAPQLSACQARRAVAGHRGSSKTTSGFTTSIR